MRAAASAALATAVLARLDLNGPADLLASTERAKALVGVDRPWRVTGKAL